MANEITVSSSVTVNNGNLQHVSRPTQFRADQDNIGGPSPGTITVPTTGVNIDLSELTVPGIGTIQNLDATNYVIYGVYNGTDFIPIHEILPGEIYPFRMYRMFGDDWTGTGTGGGNVIQLRLQADGASCKVRLDIFER